MSTTTMGGAGNGLDPSREFEPKESPSPSLDPDTYFPMTGPGGGLVEPRGVAATAGGVGGPHPSEVAPLPGGSSTQRNPRGELVVLLPALNEAAAIGHVIDRIPVDRIRAQGYAVSIWVVDGQSSDATMDIARRRGAHTFVQGGKGKGNGVRQALDHLLTGPPAGAGGDERLFVMLDADGTYPADEIPRFVEALESGEDVVLGSRLRGAIADGAITDLNLLGNRLLSALATVLFRFRVTDVCTGMWGFRERALRRFGLVAMGFDLEADLFASACERRARLEEVPISYYPRIGEPKLVPIRTGITIAWRLIARRLRRPAKGARPPLRTPIASRKGTA